MATQPLFVVSSGRAGTATMQKMLNMIPGVEMRHEYLVHIMQALAFKYNCGIMEFEAARAMIREVYSSAIFYSESKIWGDCSNKASWLIHPIARTFPKAKFIHLIRDGRKVASSYYHKLADECYEEQSVAIIRAWVDRMTGETQTISASAPMPPYEKKYWWPLPDNDKWDRFQNNCWHWQEANRVILEGLKEVDSDRQFTVRLEDLTDEKHAVPELLLDFLGLEVDHELFRDMIAFLRTPHNVSEPVDHLLTDTQTKQFWTIAGDMMFKLGYDERKEYTVNYDRGKV